MHNLMIIFYPTIYFMQINNIFYINNSLQLFNIFLFNIFTQFYIIRVLNLHQQKKFSFNV
jgi:hypothetical protein